MVFGRNLSVVKGRDLAFGASFVCVLHRKSELTQKQEKKSREVKRNLENEK